MLELLRLTWARMKVVFQIERTHHAIQRTNSMIDRTSKAIDRFHDRYGPWWLEDEKGGNDYDV